MMHGDNWIWVMLAFFMFMAITRNGRLNRQQRKLNERFDKFQATPPASPPPPAIAGPSREDVERLEHRVRVLERIVTDGGYSLASQIEALRDDPRERPAKTRQQEEQL
jgi:hypothetical protein